MKRLATRGTQMLPNRRRLPSVEIEEGEAVDDEQTISSEETNGAFVVRSGNGQLHRWLSLKQIYFEFNKIPSERLWEMEEEELRGWLAKALQLYRGVCWHWNHGNAKLNILRELLQKEEEEIRRCAKWLEEHGSTESVVLPSQTSSRKASQGKPVSPEVSSRRDLSVSNESAHEVAASVAQFAQRQKLFPNALFNCPPPNLNVPSPWFDVPSRHCLAKLSSVPAPSIDFPLPNFASSPPSMAIPPPRMAVPPPYMAIPPPRMAVPPPNMAILPPRMAVPPPGMAVPPPSVAVPPPSMAIPPPRMAVPPPAMAVLPAEIIFPPSDVGISPLKVPRLGGSAVPEALDAFASRDRNHESRHESIYSRHVKLNVN